MGYAYGDPASAGGTNLNEHQVNEIRRADRTALQSQSRLFIIVYENESVQCMYVYVGLTV